MKQRIKTGIVILLILCIFFAMRFLEISSFDFMILGIILMGTYEISNCYTKARRNNSLIALLFFVLAEYLALTICFAYNLYFAWDLLIIAILVILTSLLVILYPMFSSKSKAEFAELKSNNENHDSFIDLDYKTYTKHKWQNTMQILIYPAILLSALYFANNISKLGFASVENVTDIGLFLLISAFATSMITDTFAYLVGRLLKGPKLAPKISPNKTISGAVGGFVFGTLGAVLCFVIFSLFTSYKNLFESINFNVMHMVMIGIMGSISNQIGDLFESFVKRKLNVKDSGTIFPGHGGVMDRVDGLSFTVFLYVTLFIIALA